MKQALLSVNPASLLGLEVSLAIRAPTWGWALAIPAAGWSGAATEGSQGRPWGAAAGGSQAPGGVWGDGPNRCWNRLFRGSSLFFPCSAPTADLCFSLVERKDAAGQAEQRQAPVSPTGVGAPADFPYWRRVLPERSCQWVLGCVCRQGPFVLENVGLGLCILWRVLWQFRLLVCVCFICMIGILVAFSKVGNSGLIH